MDRHDKYDRHVELAVDDSFEERHSIRYDDGKKSSVWTKRENGMLRIRKIICGHSDVHTQEIVLNPDQAEALGVK